MGPPPGIGAAVGEGQRRRAAPLGNQLQVTLPSERQGVAVANMTGQHHVRPREIPGDPFQEGVEQGPQALSLRGESHCRWVLSDSPADAQGGVWRRMVSASWFLP